jgi:hypothetical protein
MWIYQGIILDSINKMKVMEVIQMHVCFMMIFVLLLFIKHDNIFIHISNFEKHGINQVLQRTKYLKPSDTERHAAR